MHKSTSKHLVLFITLLNLVVVGCDKTESTEPVVNMAVGLDTIRDIWAKLGQPSNFDPTNLVLSSVEHFYTYTNVVSLAGKDYHCRFAVRSKLIHTSGAMAITVDGVCLWIYDKDGKVIVSPQTNGIERIN